MIDSHCHLDHEPLAQNIQDVLSRCKSVGILTLESSLNLFDMAILKKLKNSNFMLHICKYIY